MRDLWPHQFKTRGAICEAVDAGYRRIAVACPTGGGKCLGRGTPVLMYDGSVKPVEYVQAGDVLMGPDSTPRNVLTTCSGIDPLYKVTPGRYGDPFIVNESHILSLKFTNGSRHSCGIADGSIVNISVADYLSRSKSFRHCAKLYRTRVDFAPQETPLDPYLLGVWLGDGTTKQPAITTADAEVVEEIYATARRYGVGVKEDRQPGNAAITYKLNNGCRWKNNEIRSRLTEAGVLGNKHVPLVYKANSRNVRLELLAGIVDSDGHLSHTGCYDLVFKVRALAMDVAYLARSLGFASSLRECVKTCCNNGVSGNYWRVSVVGDVSQIPVRIARKKSEQRRQKKSHLVAGFTVEPIGDGEYFGFEIDGDRLFLLGDFTVTHNTVMMLDRIESSGRPTCLYTNRTMLLEQLSRVLERDGFSHGIRAAGHKPRLLDDIQLAMVQTEASQVLELGRRDVHRAAEVFWDEVHNNVADTSMQLRERHGDCIDIGWTATPLGLGHAYDHLIVAATNSELRACGAHVPAYTYGPDEPDTKLVGKVVIGEGECGIGLRRRAVFAQRVFGRVVENYRELNPEGRPALLFAPGVAESIWFAEQLNEAGIPAAHIDGENCWIDGSLVESSNEVRDEIAARSESGSIKIVCNRFVLREGIDWPWIYHGIFATVFGSLTSYLQAGGRLLRSHPTMDHVVVQDHGGNYWRHGSLNANREWGLELTDRIVSSMRMERIREQKEPQPIHCPKCNMMRSHGQTCPKCGYAGCKTSRPVLQADGSLREMKNDTFRKRRRLSYSKQIEQDWIGRIKGICKSRKETVQGMTFAQAEVSFARDHNWQYPPRDLPMMPKRDVDWFLPVKDVLRDQLT